MFVSARGWIENWHVFYVTNFFTLMKPFFLLERVYGLMPSKVMKHYLQESKFGYLYCSIIAFVYTSLTLYILYSINTSSLTSKVIAWELQTNCFFILTNFIILSNYIFGSPKIQILHHICKLATKLPNEKLTLIAHSVYLKSLMFLYFLILTTVANIFTGRSNGFVFVVGVVVNYTYTSMYLLVFQYSNNVFVLANCFKHINEELIKLKNNAFSEKKIVSNRVYRIQFNPSLFIELKYLKNWHNELNDVIRRINSTFSVQMITIVILTFTQLTFLLYYTFLESLFGDVFFIGNTWVFFVCNVAGYHLSKLFLLTLTCQSANDENYTTRLIINEILINVDDKRFKEEVSLFIE